MKVKMSDWLASEFPRVRLLELSKDQKVYERFNEITSLTSGAWKVNILRTDYWNHRDLKFGIFKDEYSLLCTFSIRFGKVDTDSGKKRAAYFCDMRSLEKGFARDLVLLRKIYREFIAQAHLISELAEVELWLTAILDDNQKALSVFTRGRGGIFYEPLESYWVRMVPVLGLLVKRVRPTHVIQVYLPPSFKRSFNLRWYWFNGDGSAWKILFSYAQLLVQIPFGQLAIASYGNLKRLTSPRIKIPFTVIKEGTLYSVHLEGMKSSQVKLTAINFDFL